MPSHRKNDYINLMSVNSAKCSVSFLCIVLCIGKAFVSLNIIVHQEMNLIFGYFILFFNNKDRYAAEWQLNLLKVLNC